MKRALLLILALAPLAPAQQICAECHAKIYQSYSRTAMGRSFAKAPAQIHTGAYFHKPSNTHFEMIERNGQLFQRRWQIGFQGREENVDENSVDYVMGSGTHAVTYLHRMPSGALQELPLGWYSEKGGYLAMNPGYDKPYHEFESRKISYECMGCHNAFPAVPVNHDQPRATPIFSGELPLGIDCQRCHGPGSDHVKIAKTPGASPEAIRAAVVNPAKLSPARQMDVCSQCHLETTSFDFPRTITKYGHGTYSFRPGQVLGDTTLYFDHPGPDRFQIVNATYRLRMSQCFLRSEGKMTCITCHNPHEDTPRDSNAVCSSCHKTLEASHTPSRACIDCHMPKRRTDDAVHVVMTDHFIQRRKPGRDLLAAKAEPSADAAAYHGEVLPYYPQPFPRTPESELYIASAQVLTGNNTDAGIPRLTAALNKYQPAEAGFYVNLAEALMRKGRPVDALPFFDAAISRNPNSLAALLGYAVVMSDLKRTTEAISVFRRATEILPDDPMTWLGLGEAFIRAGQRNEGLLAVKKSIELDPEIPEAHYLFGVEAASREAIRLKPTYADAHLNLALALIQRKANDDAEYHLKTALQIRPIYPQARQIYAQLLRSLGRNAEADEQMRLSGAQQQPVPARPAAPGPQPQRH